MEKSEEGELMSKKEFAYHMNEFMGYMRKMEASMSENWDRMHEFQKTVMKQATTLIDNLTSHEKLADYRAIVDGIEKKVDEAQRKIREAVQGLLDEREKFAATVDREKRSRWEWTQELVKTLKQFEPLRQEDLAMKGALQALRFVQEFKESYEYLQKVKSVLTERELPNFGYFPKGVEPALWTLPIDEVAFSVRATNRLSELGVRTVGELASLTPGTIMAARSMGRKTLKEIEQKLEDMGLRLGMKEGKNE